MHTLIPAARGVVGIWNDGRDWIDNWATSLVLLSLKSRKGSRPDHTETMFNARSTVILPVKEYR